MYSYRNIKLSPAPAFDLDEEFKVQAAVKALIQNQLLQSAHDVADGGLYITMVESAMPNELGFDVKSDASFRKDAYLFGESQSRVVISVQPDKKDALEEILSSQNISFTQLGTVTNNGCRIDEENFHNIGEIKNLYDTALEKIMN